MLRPATPLTILLLGAFGLLIMSIMSTPIVRMIPLASFAGIDFGVFGFCKGKKCSHIELGYDTSSLFNDVQSSTFNLPSSTRATLSTLLIVHPIAAFFTMNMLILAASAHFHAPSHSPRYLLGIFILSILTLIASLLSFLIDVLLFVPHMKWGSYLVLAATILIAASGIISCAMRRTLVSRKARKRRIAENAEMNGENFYNRQGPSSTMVPATAGTLATGGLGDGRPAFATFDSSKKNNILETTSDERIPLTQRTSIQNLTTGPALMGKTRNSQPQRMEEFLPRDRLSANGNINQRPTEPYLTRPYSGSRGGFSPNGDVRGTPRGGFHGPGRGGYGPTRASYGPTRGGHGPTREIYRSPIGGFESSAGVYLGPPRETLMAEGRRGRDIVSPGLTSPSRYGSPSELESPSIYGSSSPKPYDNLTPSSATQSPYGMYAPTLTSVYSTYNPNTSDNNLPRAESPPPLSELQKCLDQPKNERISGAIQIPPVTVSGQPENFKPISADDTEVDGYQYQNPSQGKMIIGEGNRYNSDELYIPSQSAWEKVGRSPISNSSVPGASGMPSENTGLARVAPIDNYLQPSHPGHVNHPATPAPVAPRPTKPIVGIETRFGLNSDTNYDEFSAGPRSPAESEISNFTSVSQRGINPRWNDGGAYGGSRKMVPQRKPVQQRNDILFNDNPDFVLPTKRGAYGMAT